MAERIHNVTVILQDGRHKCVPSPTHVKGGDTVHWGSAGVPIFFVPNSPFEEGTGPIRPGTNSIVKKGLKKDARFTGRVGPDKKSAPVEGDIIVEDPG